MASLDEISFLLGKLDNKVDEIREKMDPLTQRVTAMEPHVEHYKKVRRWGGSFAASILAAAGASGGAASSWLIKKFGG